MGRKLTTYVWVDDVRYGPDKQPSAAAAKKITNPDVWADDGQDDGDGVSELDVRKAEGMSFGLPDQRTNVEIERVQDDGQDDGQDDETVPEPVTESPASEGDSDQDASASAGTVEAAQEPPRGGPGSGEKAWRAFLTGQGVEVPDEASREDLIALWDKRR